MGPKRSLFCGVCNKNIPKSVFKIKCDGCKEWHHPDCAKLSELDIRVMGEQNKTWFCNGCKRQSLTVASNNQSALNSQLEYE